MITQEKTTSFLDRASISTSTRTPKISDRCKELVVAHSEYRLTDFLNIAEADGFSNESTFALLHGFTKLTLASPDRYFPNQIREYFN